MADESTKDDGIDMLLTLILECRKMFVAIREELRIEGCAYTLVYTKAELAVMRIDKMLRDNGHERALLNSVMGVSRPSFPSGIKNNTSK